METFPDYRLICFCLEYCVRALCRQPAQLHASAFPCSSSLMCSWAEGDPPLPLYRGLPMMYTGSSSGSCYAWPRCCWHCTLPRRRGIYRIKFGIWNYLGQGERQVATFICLVPDSLAVLVVSGSCDSLPLPAWHLLFSGNTSPVHTRPPPPPPSEQRPCQNNTR